MLTSVILEQNVLQKWNILFCGLYIAVVIMLVVICIVLRITNLQRRIDFEQQISNLKLRFFTDLSHELRTPLTILKGNVQLCQARYGDNKAFTRLGNTIEDMQLLVDTLLAIARNTTNTLTLEHRSLFNILQELQLDLDSVGQAKGIQIHLQQHGDEQIRQLYPSMTKMVFGNILRNALNYSQGSEIDIILQKNKVLIADNGIGINLPNDVKVQELSSRQLKLETKGHGIGLQLVQKLCMQLGWRVELFDRQYYLTIQSDIDLKPSTGLIVVVYLS